MSIDNLYKPGYKVQSKTETPDAGGVVVSTWSNTYSSIKGHMRTATQKEITNQFNIGGINQQTRHKEEQVADHVFYTKTSYTITHKDMIISPDGEAFSVKTVDNPHSLDKFLRVMCYRSDFEVESDE